MGYLVMVPQLHDSIEFLDMRIYTYYRVYTRICAYIRAHTRERLRNRLGPAGWPPLNTSVKRFAFRSEVRISEKCIEHEID